MKPEGKVTRTPRRIGEIDQVMGALARRGGCKWCCRCEASCCRSGRSGPSGSMETACGANRSRARISSSMGVGCCPAWSTCTPIRAPRTSTPRSVTTCSDGTCPTTATAGVLLVRTPGSAAPIPGWVDEDPDLPRVHSAGRWLATPGRFFPGVGRDVSEAGLVHAAVEEAKTSSGWCKVIADWKYDEPPLPQEILAAVVRAVHAIGGRVAAHCQTADGSRNAVEAGVDSLEHGMHLDPGLIDLMAAQGTAFVPTLSVFGAGADRWRAAEPSARRDWWLAGWEGMMPNIRAAHEAGCHRTCRYRQPPVRNGRVRGRMAGTRRTLGRRSSGRGIVDGPLLARSARTGRRRPR